MSDTKTKQDKITPASHGDELDVLEALYWVGKNKDLNLLSQDQLDILIDSGRINKVYTGNDTSNSLNNTVSRDVDLSMLKEMVVKEVLGEFMKIMKSEIIKDNGEDFWKGLNEEQQLTAINTRMYVQYKTSVQDFSKKITRVLEI